MARSTPPTTDRGTARRTAILDASLRVIARDGAAGLTHRAVALEAEVPLAAMTYYFASRDELLIHAFSHLTARQLVDLATEAAAPPHAETAAGLADVWSEVLLEELAREPDLVRADLEMHLAAARAPELREIQAHVVEAHLAYLERQLAAIGSSKVALDSLVVLHLIVGLQVGALADPRSPAARPPMFGAILRRALEALVGTRSGARRTRRAPTPAVPRRPRS